MSAPASDYVELHASSAFSFLRGASQPEALAGEAARLGLPALGLLDRDGIYSAPRLYQAARAAGVRPIVGAEITLEDGSALPLLVENRTGYQNLCRLLTGAKHTPRRAGLRLPDELPPDLDPRARKRPCFATWAEIAAHAEGLVALTGDDEGPLARAWRRGGARALGAAFAALAQVFRPEQLYVEVQRHRVRGEEAFVQALADLAAAAGRPLLATGGALHATREERPLADVFACLRHHTTLDAAGHRLLANAERHLHPAAVMAQRFADLPEAIRNTARLASRLEFTLDDLGYQFPDFPVGPGETMDGVLRAWTEAGARERLGTLTPALQQQIEHELAVIAQLGFAGYFLIVADICAWARGRGILIQGRGSAANSAACFALGITAVNPLQHQLLFERFLNADRVGAGGRPSWPDIDLDLPSGDLRESIIQEVYRRYQPRGAAMVANVITYRGRSTARDVGKVLGLPEDVIDRFSALYGNGDFPHTLDLREQVRLAGLPAGHPRATALLWLYGRIKGLPRHLGQHSGGMILCPGRLDTIVPIEPAAMEGRCVVQWDKDDCEDLGLVKIDFLGLGMMAVLQDCLQLCGERGGPATLHTINATADPATYAAMQRADTVGVFQIESRAQMATLPRFRPACFYDVAMQVSIVRPGPIVGKLVHPLIRRRQGLEPEEYLDPSVEALVKPVLERTRGVILFQEQMLKLSMVLARFTGGEAEELRRAMGFSRHPERLERALAKLRAALRREGHNETVVEKVISSCTAFAAYGFPESHAISFALLAYASTWLKVHRPAELLASLLNHQPMGFYSPATLVQDARRHGVRVRPVCVVASAWACTVEGERTVRLGLGCVKGLRERAGQALIAARTAAPWRSLDDFLLRTPCTPAERRALASVGALNALAAHRRAALWQVEAAWEADDTLFRHAALGSGDTGELAVAEAGADDRGEARRGDAATPAAGPAIPLAAMTPVERLGADFRAMALTAGDHPMALVRDQLPDVWCAADLPLGRDGDTVIVAGSVICRQRPGTAKGFVFVSLEDETGIANCVVRPDLYEQVRLTLNQEPALRITGRLQNQAGVIHVQVVSLAPLHCAEVPAQSSHDFR